VSGYTSFGFEVPQGDPGAVAAAADSLAGLGVALEAQSRALAGGAHAALGAHAWEGLAADAFAGYASHVVSACTLNESTCGDTAAALRSFAGQLAHAQSVTRQALADCEQYQGELGSQLRLADTAGDAARTASQVAAAAPHPAVAAEYQRQALQAANEQATAQGAANAAQSHLEDAQRRGQLAFEVYQIEAAALDARLESAAGTLRPAPSLPGETSLGDKVNADLGYGLSPWALLTTPPAAVAGYRYLRVTSAIRNLPKALAATFDFLDQLAFQVDALLPGGGNEIRGYKVTAAVAASLGLADERTDIARAFADRGGLADTKLLTAAGRTFGLAGIASDYLTFRDPGGQTSGQNDAIKIAAGANAASTAVTLVGTDGVVSTAALVGINAGTDWIPVVGEGVMLGTGLYLAGTWAYQTFKPFHDLVDATGRTVSSAGHDAGHFLTHDVFGLI
jgi:hypothetical protein